METAKANRRLHLGMGCYIKTDNPRKDIRTLNNATCQFWSILTLLTINKMHALIDEADLQDDVKCISTIYDSIYFIVKADPVTVKWVNDRLIPVMSQDFMENQTIKNEATSEIGLDWVSLQQISHNASEDEITKVLSYLPYHQAAEHAVMSKLITTYYPEDYTKFRIPISDKSIWLSTLAEIINTKYKKSHTATLTDKLVISKLPK